MLPPTNLGFQTYLTLYACIYSYNIVSPTKYLVLTETHSNFSCRVRHDLDFRFVDVFITFGHYY